MAFNQGIPASAGGSRPGLPTGEGKETAHSTGATYRGICDGK